MIYYKIRTLVYTVIICLVANSAWAQNKTKRSTRALTFGFQYVPVKPMGEMGKNYGVMSGIGFGVGYKTSKNWQLGAYTRFLFGNRIYMANPLQYINTIDGDIINADGNLIQPRYYSRGLQVMAEVSKIHLLNKKKNNSTGILVSFGVGYVHHKLRIEIIGEGAPQLYPDYKRGYDRFHSGLCMNQYIGFQYMDPKHRTVNFNIGLELNEAWTVNRRGFNYDEMKHDTKVKQDYFPALRLCWFIPRYIKGYVDDEGYRWK